MAKKTVTLDTSVVKNPKVKLIGSVVGAIVLLVIAFNLGDSGGYKRGLAEGLDTGNRAGFERGDEAGFENGYWLGRGDGCEWVFDTAGKSKIIGIGNPYTTWYYLMDLGSTYIDRTNCSTSGHGAAPYVPAPYIPSANGSN